MNDQAEVWNNQKPFKALIGSEDFLFLGTPQKSRILTLRCLHVDLGRDLPEGIKANSKKGTEREII